MFSFDFLVAAATAAGFFYKRSFVEVIEVYFEKKVNKKKEKVIKSNYA